MKTLSTLFSPNSQSRFIQDALHCTTPLGLSYSDPDQKWIILHHLTSLIRNCPYLKPTVAIFTHNDGSQPKLLAAAGSLPLSPPVPLTIWVHELYPHAPPIVFVDVEQTGPFPVYHNHPFVDPTTGAVTSSYLITWDANRSSLTELVGSLVRLFNQSHPFYHVGGRRRSSRNPAHLSKTDAMDQLAEALFHDLRASTAENDAEIRRLAAVQARLQERAKAAAGVVGGLERERRMLKEKVNLVCEEFDVIMNWVKEHEKWNLEIDRFFEISDKCKEKMEMEANDKAIEESLYEMEKALEEGVVGFGEYIKEVRKMAREQFQWKEMMRRIEFQGPHLLMHLLSSPTAATS